MILNVSSNLNDSRILWIGLSINFVASVGPWEVWQVWAIPAWLLRLSLHGSFDTTDELTKRKLNPTHSWSGSPWTCRGQRPALPCFWASIQPRKSWNTCVVQCQHSSLSPVLWEVSGSLWKMVCSSSTTTHSSWHELGHLQLIKEKAYFFWSKIPEPSGGHWIKKPISPKW